MRIYQILALSALVFFTGCHRLVKVEDPAIFSSHLAQISDINSQVLQIKASLDIKGRGFFGSFFHEQADIIAQKPDKLYWSLRSFFGSPALVLATDGRYLTMYDFLGSNPRPYQKFLLTDDSVFDLLEFKFHPQSLIFLLMAQVPLGSNIEIKTSDNKMEVSSTLGEWVTTSLVDLAKRRVLKTRLVNATDGISYKASYADFAPGIDFPESLVLQIKGPTSTADLDIRLSSVEINGDPVSSNVFHLKQH